METALTQSHMRSLVWIVALSCLCIVHARTQSLSIPEVHRRVNDLTGTLSSSEVSSLESTLQDFERSTSNQIVVLMIPSLEGESLEDVSLQAAEKNKLGKKEHNNGVLLFIAKDDHKVRIEVGYGLEGALPDAISDQIIRHEIVPRFRRGDFDGGVEAGVQAIMAATKGEYVGDGSGGSRERSKLSLGGIIALIIFITILRASLLGSRHYIGRRGYYGGPWFWGGGGGFGGGGFGGGGGFSGGGGSFGGGGASGGW